MSSSLAIGGLIAALMLSPALAQSNAPQRNDSTRATSETRAKTTGMWRASKLKGLNVYNEQNEKLGDITEMLIDKSGKVAGVVIGVGGFLGMGEHDIKVDMNKLRFVDEPVRTSSTNTNPPANTANRTTENRDNRPANTTTSGQSSTTANDRRWYPDHAILSGANRDQLKAMPEFKFD